MKLPLNPQATAAAAIRSWELRVAGDTMFPTVVIPRDFDVFPVLFPSEAGIAREVIQPAPKRPKKFYASRPPKPKRYVMSQKVARERGLIL